MFSYKEKNTNLILFTVKIVKKDKSFNTTYKMVDAFHNFSHPDVEMVIYFVAYTMDEQENGDCGGRQYSMQNDDVMMYYLIADGVRVVRVVAVVSL